MPLAVRCPHCSAKFRAQDEHAGKTANCPACTKPFRLPTARDGAAELSRVAQPAAVAATESKANGAAPAAPVVRAAGRAAKASAPPSKALAGGEAGDAVAKQVLGGFSGPIKRTRTPITYQLSAIAVAVVMVLLPVAYVGLIALTGYGVYWHAINHYGLLTSHALGRGRQQAILAMIYITPLIGGTAMILFMIKPLFARPARAGRIRFLNRDHEPLMFAFVDRICETVGAPRPKRIDLDLQVNASASFRRGWLSLFGRDLVLTIGMPLIAGLNTRQLAGVLAHEFGHFSQGFGMRLTYLIRSVNFWFMRVVYHRDRADEWLAHAAANWDDRISWVLQIAQAFVYLSRRVLWLLMHVGHFFASHLLRQMEFDADRYETRLAGTDAFVQTIERLHLLGYASDAAMADLGDFYQEGRLGDDLPRLVMNRLAEAPAELKLAIDQRIANSRTGWFDSHPCDAARVAAAQAQAAEGVYRVELPATALLADFTAQSKATTLDLYRAIFGSKFDPRQLRPVKEIERRQEKARAGNAAIERYFHGEWHVAAPLAMNTYYLAPPSKPNEALAELKRVRQEMQEKAAGLQGAAQKLSEAYGRAGEMERRLSLIRAGAKIKKELAKEWGGEAKVRKDLTRALDDIDKAAAKLDEFNKVAARRAALALSLLQLPQVANRIEPASVDVTGLDAVFESLRTLGEQMRRLAGLQRLHSALSVLLEGLESGGKPEDIVPIIQDLAGKLLPPVKHLRSSLERGQFPYEHGQGSVSLAAYLMPTVPISDDLASLYNSCGQALEMAPTLYVRMLGQVVEAAEAVEAACGLPKVEARAAASA